MSSTTTYQVPSIIGLPPLSSVSEAMIRNTMPYLEIKPKLLTPGGPLLYQLRPAKAEYEGELKKINIIPPPDGKLKVAYIADSFPSESFTNEYGDTVFQRLTDTVSDMALQLGQITNIQTLTDAMKGFGDVLGKTDEVMIENLPVVGTAISPIMNIGKNLADWLGDQGQTHIQTMKGHDNQVIRALGRVGEALDASPFSRLDFPQYWKSSSYSPTYTITVRLFNPEPMSKESTMKHIYTPLGAILALAVPRTISDSEHQAFSWPFFTSIHCPGLFTLKNSAISNVTVVKGGDQHSIAYNHRMGIIDVRIEFISLFSTLTNSTIADTSRPTLKGYLEALVDQKNLFVAERETAKSKPGGAEVPVAGTPRVDGTSKTIAAQLA